MPELSRTTALQTCSVFDVEVSAVGLGARLDFERDGLCSGLVLNGAASAAPFRPTNPSGFSRVVLKQLRVEQLLYAIAIAARQSQFGGVLQNHCVIPVWQRS